MLRKMLISLFLMLLLLTGCNSNQNNRILELDKELQNVNTKLSEVEKLRDEINELLLQSNDKIKQLQETTEGNVNDGTGIRVVRCIDDVLFYVFENDQHNTAMTKTIIGYNRDNILEGYDIDVLDYKGDGVGIVELKIVGSLYDFSITRLLEWGPDEKDIVFGEVICEFDEVRNKDILFSSALSEGMPSEVVKWKDDKGNEHSIFISYDGYGFGGTVIWKK